MRTPILAIVDFTSPIAMAQQNEPKGRRKREDRSKNTHANDLHGKGFSVGGEKQTHFEIDVTEPSIGLSLGRPNKDSITTSLGAFQDLQGNITEDKR